MFLPVVNEVRHRTLDHDETIWFKVSTSHQVVLLGAEHAHLPNTMKMVESIDRTSSAESCPRTCGIRCLIYNANHQLFVCNEASVKPFVLEEFSNSGSVRHLSVSVCLTLVQSGKWRLKSYLTKDLLEPDPIDDCT